MTNKYYQAQGQPRSDSSATEPSSSPKTPQASAWTDSWTGNDMVIPCIKRSNSFSRSCRSLSQATQTVARETEFFGDPGFEKPPTYSSGVGYLEDRQRKEAGLGQLPVPFSSASANDAFCAQESAISIPQYPAGPYDLSLRPSDGSGHVNGMPAHPTWLPASHHFLDPTSSYNLPPTGVSEAYVDSFIRHPSYTYFEKPRTSLIPCEGYTMSRQGNLGSSVPGAGNQYGPPDVKHLSRSHDSPSSMQGSFSIPESSHTQQAGNFSTSPSQVPHFGRASSNYTLAPPSERQYSSLRFPDLEQLCNVYYDAGCDPSSRRLEPDVRALVEKNIFFNEVATCYRRNYISVQTWYHLPDCTPSAKLYCVESEFTGPRQVQAFGISLSATIDKPHGKSVALIQHTPKRDRGPKSPPIIIMLPPAPTGNESTHAYSMATSLNGPDLPLQNAESQRSPVSTSQHTFERIQFQQATANNGRRRAQQQYYYLIVELHADCRLPNDPMPHWVKVSKRISEPMVVRGRSPGHYKDNSHDPSSAGPGPGPANAGSDSQNFDNYHGMRSMPSSSNMGISFRGNNDAGGSSYHTQHQAHHFTGHPSPAYTSRPSPVHSHGEPSTHPPFAGPGRYHEEVTMPKHESGHHVHHHSTQYLHHPPLEQDAYPDLRHMRGDSSLDVPEHGLATPGSMKSEPMGWHSTNCGGRYTPVNVGFALDASAGY